MFKRVSQSELDLRSRMSLPRIGQKRALCLDHLHQHDAPILLIDESEIHKSLKYFETHLPYVKLHYAMKANNHEAILAMIRDRGLGLDVASSGEIRQANAAGFRGDQLILANTIKSEETIHNIFRYEIQTFTFDSPSDLKRIAKYRDQSGSAHKPRCLLRLRPILRTSDGKEVELQVDLSKKFGCDPKMAVEMFRLARELDLNPAGVAFHVGSNCESPQAFVDNFNSAAQLLEKANRELGMQLNVIDIGGGFPNMNAEARGIDDLGPFYVEIAKGLKAARAERYEVLSEPGRTICGPSGVLVSKIIGITELNGQTLIFLNEGIYGHYSGIMNENASFMYFPLEERWFNKSVKMMPYTLAGPTCCSADMLAENIYLPAGLEVGEHLFTVDIGAYSRELATAFNGCIPAQTIFVPALKKAKTA